MAIDPKLIRAAQVALTDSSAADQLVGRMRRSIADALWSDPLNTTWSRDGIEDAVQVAMKTYCAKLTKAKELATEVNWQPCLGPEVEKLGAAFAAEPVGAAANGETASGKGRVAFELLKLCSVSYWVKAASRERIKRATKANRLTTVSLDDTATEKLRAPESDAPSAVDGRIDCDSFLASLDPIDQRIVFLRVEGFTEAEIGSSLGCHKSTVSRHLHKIGQLLRVSLGGDWQPGAQT